MQHRVALLIAFALGASLVLAAGRAGMLPVRVMPNTPTASPPVPDVPLPAAQAPTNMPATPPAAARSETTASRTSICEQSRGTPSLVLLPLSAGDEAWFGVHCGDHVEVFALSDGVVPVPRRVMQLIAHTPGPDMLAVSAPLSTADVDGDGAVDLLAATRFDDATGAPRTGAVYLLQRVAHGSFALPTALGAQAVVAMTSARIFGGPGADVVSLGLLDPRQNLPSELLLVRGGAAPVRAGRLSVGVGARDVVATDVNLDGRDELVITAAQPPLEILSLDANGAVHSRATEPPQPPAIPDTGLLGVTSADVDGDGKLDFVGHAAGDIVVWAAPGERRARCSLPSETNAPVAVRLVTRASHTEAHALLLTQATTGNGTRIELVAMPCSTSQRVALPHDAQPLQNAPLHLRYDLR